MHPLAELEINVQHIKRTFASIVCLFNTLNSRAGRKDCGANPMVVLSLK